jgi:putative aldouronate transport system substrate-binding protein
VAAHKNVLSEFNKLLTKGAADTDDILARMKNKDKAAGIDKICSEIETQLQAWKATQK